MDQFHTCELSFSTTQLQFIPQIALFNTLYTDAKSSNFFGSNIAHPSAKSQKLSPYHPIPIYSAVIPTYLKNTIQREQRRPGCALMQRNQSGISQSMPPPGVLNQEEDLAPFNSD